MSSQRLTESNRRNAALSTGPRTPQGKSRSSLNALKHGLAAERAVVQTGEDLAEYTALRDSLLDDLQPVTAAEQVLAEHVISTAWSLRRIYRAETGLFSYSATLLMDSGREMPNVPAAAPFMTTQNALNLLSRYRTVAERAFHKALREYENYRTKPIPETVPLPDAFVPSPDTTEVPDQDNS